MLSTAPGADTSAILNDLGIYVLSKVHKWQHLRGFKNIPKFYTTDPEAWRIEYWQEIKGAAGQVVFQAQLLITGRFFAYLGPLFTVACHYKAGDSHLSWITEMCYDQLAVKRFEAYDSICRLP